VPRGLTRRLPILVLATALAAVLATGCAKEAAAARVGDDTISNQDLMDEVKALYDNDALWAQSQGGRAGLKGEAKGSYAQSFVAGVLQQRITFKLLGHLFDKEGDKLTGSLRDQAREELVTNQFGQAFNELPKDYRDSLTDDYAKVIALQTKLGASKFNTAVEDLIETTDVKVNSRYGHWDADTFRNAPDKLAIVPPAGATKAGGKGTTTTTTVGTGSPSANG